MGFHLIVVIAAFAAGPYIAWKAIRKETSFLLYGALALPIFIIVGIGLNGGECLLQTWAKQLRGVEEGWARDIYLLPEWFAHQVVFVGAVLYVSGLVIYIAQLIKAKEKKT